MPEPTRPVAPPDGVSLRFDSADYELLWPPEALARELAGVRADPNAKQRHERIEFLLEVAFLGEQPLADYQQACQRASERDDPWGTRDPWAPDEADLLDGEGFLDRLAAQLPRLRAHHEPAPYWPARHGRDRAGGALAPARHRFAALINEWRAMGYFGRTLPPECVDDHDPPNESAVLAERLGVPDLWPLTPDSWDEDTFLGLIEVFHDLAVRPRERNLHSYNGCGWHYSAFNTDTGRALYRWRINRLLASAGMPLQLADSGEDAGRLVRTVDDARTDLLDRALRTPNPGVADRIAHAIAQFRNRAAAEHDKRSAIITLAGILEERRELIREQLGRKDEGALFTIANEFAIRHQRRGQQGDYDPAFLDWIFWWYLATIELTDRLLAGQGTGTAADT